MAFLLDTNVLSELRKKRRNEPKVQGWLGSVDSEDLFTSVIVVGEIRRGIEKIRPTDPVFASKLELWLRRLKVDYQDRILSITEEIAEFWGTVCPNDPLPEPDGLIAATALHHGMMQLYIERLKGGKMLETVAHDSERFEGDIQNLQCFAGTAPVTKRCWACDKYLRHAVPVNSSLLG